MDFSHYTDQEMIDAIEKAHQNTPADLEALGDELEKYFTENLDLFTTTEDNAS